MKQVMYIGFMALLIWACSSTTEAPNKPAKLTQSANDSTEYELVIIDPYFDTWYLMNFNQAKDRSDEYYRSKNLVAVSYWNDYYRRDRYSRVIDSHIYYEPQIDYGIALNRELYWYFRYVEDEYGVKLW